MIKKLLSYYIYSNIHISIAAGVYVAGAFVISGADISLFWAGLVSLATFVVYNAHRYIGYYQTLSDQLPQRILFIKKYRWQLTALSIVGLSVLLNRLLAIQLHLLYPYIPLTIITALYLLPILPAQKRLRDLPYIKIFLIAVVWAAVFATVYYSFSSDGSMIPTTTLLIEKSLFFILITLPFDYRDREIDRTQGVSTLATALSVRGLQSLSFVLFVLLLLALSVQYHLDMIDLPLCLSLSVFYLMSLCLCLWGLERRSELYYLGVLDGLILLNGLIYLIQ